MPSFTFALQLEPPAPERSMPLPFAGAGRQRRASVAVNAADSASELPPPLLPRLRTLTQDGEGGRPSQQREPAKPPPDNRASSEAEAAAQGPSRIQIRAYSSDEPQELTQRAAQRGLSSPLALSEDLAGTSASTSSAARFSSASSTTASGPQAAAGAGGQGTPRGSINEAAPEASAASPLSAAVAASSRLFSVARDEVGASSASGPPDPLALAGADADAAAMASVGSSAGVPRRFSLVRSSCHRPSTGGAGHSQHGLHASVNGHSPITPRSHVGTPLGRNVPAASLLSSGSRSAHGTHSPMAAAAAAAVSLSPRTSTSAELAAPGERAQSPALAPAEAPSEPQAAPSPPAVVVDPDLVPAPDAGASGKQERLEDQVSAALEDSRFEAISGGGWHARGNVLIVRRGSTTWDGACASLHQPTSASP